MLSQFEKFIIDQGYSLENIKIEQIKKYIKYVRKNIFEYNKSEIDNKYITKELLDYIYKNPQYYIIISKLKYNNFKISNNFTEKIESNEKNKEFLKNKILYEEIKKLNIDKEKKISYIILDSTHYFICYKIKNYKEKSLLDIIEQIKIKYMIEDYTLFNIFAYMEEDYNLNLKMLDNNELNEEINKLNEKNNKSNKNIKKLNENSIKLSENILTNNIIELKKEEEINLNLITYKYDKELEEYRIYTKNYSKFISDFDFNNRFIISKYIIEKLDNTRDIDKLKGFILTDDYFRKYFGHIIFKKRLKEDLIMNNYQYKINEENWINEEFNQKFCSKGGLYFTQEKYISLFKNYGPKEVFVEIKQSNKRNYFISIETYKIKSECIFIKEKI